jgi:RND family efflux transporter MFP subunit
MALLGVMAGCGPKGGAPLDEHAGEEAGGHDEHAEEGGHADEIELTAEAVKIAGIELETASKRLMQAEFKATGVVTTTAQGRAVVTPPVDGKVIRFHVSVGQSVKAGQAIATLQSSELAQAASLITASQQGVIAAESSVRAAQSEYDLARAERRTAEDTLARQRELAKAGAFSQPSVQQAQREVNEAEAELQAAGQDLQVHQSQLERAERLYKQELISKTDLEEARLKVDNDKVRLAAANREHGLATANLAREKEIAQRGLTNAREVQAAEADVRASTLKVERARIGVLTARSGVASAQKAVQAARSNYAALGGRSGSSGGNVTVVAPISGIVADREATLGQAVERTTELCEIENLKSVWVTTSVPEKEIGRAKVGAPAQVAVAAFPGRIFRGTVQVVGTRLDPKSRTMPVQVLVDNSQGELRSDMFATVGLGVGGKEMVLAVSRDAIVDEGDLKFVFVEEEAHHFKQIPVVTGRVQGGFVEISEGLEEGQGVVIKGVFVLKSEKVKGELKGHEH